MHSTALIQLAALVIIGQADVLESGKYEWIITLNGQVQRQSCEIECTDDKFIIKSGRKDPVPGTIKDGEVAFRLQNDANFLKGSGKVGEDGWVRGKMSLGQGEVTFAKGTFIIAPRNTLAQIAAIDAYFKSRKPKLGLPAKSARPAVKEYPRQELSDGLGNIKVDAPNLGGEMKLSKSSVSPVTTMFRFEFEGGDIAVLISTKMRDDRPKDDTAVVRVEPRYQRLRQRLGSDSVRVAILGEAPNRMLEYSVVNAVDNPFFPLSVSNGNSKVLDRAAVSQIMVRSGRFLEFSILEKNYDAESEDALIKRLTAACRKWRESLEIKE